MLPQISIITVTYNAEKFIERTINSIKALDYSNIEYIIIDGASTDNTLKIANRHKDSIAKLISEPDIGIYDAMNKGLSIATGDYVWFINAGDEAYRPDTLEKAINSEVTLWDVYFGESMITDLDGKEIGLRRLSTPQKLSWKSLLNGMVVSHQSFIVKKDIAPKYDLEYSYSADFDWVIRCLKNADSIKNTQIVLSKFLDGGQTKQTIIPGLKERFRIMKNHYGFYPSFFSHFKLGVRFFSFLLRYKRF